MQDAPPILPALVTLGAAEVGDQLYLNVEAYNGVNVSGDDIAVRAWLANALWEVAGGLLDESLLDSSAGAEASMLSRRASRWEAWPTTIMVIVDETQNDRWDVIASAPSAALMSMNRRFATGLDIDITNGVLSVPPSKSQRPFPSSPTSSSQRFRTVLDEIDADPIDQPTLQLDAPAREPIEEFDKAVDDLEPPSWPVMINVIGDHDEGHRAFVVDHAGQVEHHAGAYAKPGLHLASRDVWPTRPHDDLAGTPARLGGHQPFVVDALIVRQGRFPRVTGC